MSVKDHIYGFYENLVMASWLGQFAPARWGSDALFYILFKMPPIVAIAVGAIILWRLNNEFAKLDG